MLKKIEIEIYIYYSFNIYLLLNNQSDNLFKAKKIKKNKRKYN